MPDPEKASAWAFPVIAVCVVLISSWGFSRGRRHAEDLKAVEAEQQRKKLEASQRAVEKAVEESNKDWANHAKGLALAEKGWGTDEQHRKARAFAEKVVRSSLRDPEGARFRWADSTDQDNWDFFLNARNGFGGFLGEKKLSSTSGSLGGSSERMISVFMELAVEKYRLKVDSGVE